MARLWPRCPWSIHGHLRNKHRCPEFGDSDGRHRVVERTPSGMGMVDRGEDQERSEGGEGRGDTCVRVSAARRWSEAFACTTLGDYLRRMRKPFETAADNEVVLGMYDIMITFSLLSVSPHARP